MAKFCLTPLTLLLIWNYLILFCLNRKMTFADWRFQIFKNNKGTLMVLILLVYISISFCSNFLYAQICRVGVEMHSRQSSVNSVMSWLLSIIRAEDVYYWEQPEDLIFYFTAGLCLLTFLASGRPGLGRREPGRQLNWCSTISTLTPIPPSSLSWPPLSCLLTMLQPPVPVFC